MTEQFVISMYRVLMALSPFAMERMADRIRTAGRSGIDSILPSLGYELTRLLEEAGQEPGAGHALAHVFASEVFAEMEAEDRYEAEMAESEHRAHYNNQLDREMEWAARDIAQYGYVDA